MKRIVLLSSFLVIALIIAPKAEGQGFYHDKRISLIVGFSPGGGYDLYARLIARHLGKYIPGVPSVIVKNMSGAGSVIAANYLYNVARKDGTVIGTIAPTQVVADLLGNPAIEFEMDKFNWLVAASTGDVAACVARSELGIRTLDDAINSKKPLATGVTNPGSMITITSRIYKKFLGANLKIISGYNGSTPIRAALDRKELDVGCWFWTSMKARSSEMLKDGSVVVFSQMGTKAAPDLPGVQNAFNRAKTEEEKIVFSLAVADGALGRPYVAPPGVPEERIAILRKAFMATLADPQLLREAKKLKLEINPLGGDKVQEWVSEIKKSPLAILERNKELFTK